MKVIEKNFSAPIINLQHTLGLTQEGMARAIGCTLAAYIKWIRGERNPSGEWLIKMIELCPNEDCISKFGIDLARFKKGQGREVGKPGGVFLEPDDWQIPKPKRRR